MKVGLIDVDSHHFPNLCLMKLSSFHKLHGHCVEWYDGSKHYDIVYQSKVFTDLYTADTFKKINADTVIKGGTGYDLKNKLPDEVESIMPDYSIYPQYEESYGFLTRGCPRGCLFCIVQKKEGCKSVQVADLDSFNRCGKTVKLLDPNLLACNNHEALLQQLIACRQYIDFTQGLDARLITRENAGLLAKIKAKRFHFAFDDMKQEKSIVRGLSLFKEVTGFKEYKTRVYILTNFNTTHEEDLYRIRTVQALGYYPYIMVFNKPSAPLITRQLQRWSNNPFIYNGTGKNFANYTTNYNRKCGEQN